MCKTKLVHEVMREERQSDSFYRGSVQQTGKNIETWIVNLTIGNTPVAFKIDTGADVTIMSEQSFQNLQKKQELCQQMSHLTVQEAS